MKESKEHLLQSLPIRCPEYLFDHYSYREIADMFSSSLDEVYQGKSDSLEGYPSEKFLKMMVEGKFFPFLAFDGNRPVAGAAWRWYSPKMDLGNAFVLSEYRGQDSPIRGKDIYMEADRWGQTHFGNKAVSFTGVFRVPESAAIAINHQGWLPYWYAPLASYGFPDELLTSSGRDQEFLILGEKYVKGIKIPTRVYIPSEIETSNLIRLMWGQSVEFGLEGAKLATSNVFSVTRGDEERIRLGCDYLGGEKLVSLSEATRYAFEGNKQVGFSKTRILFVDVPADKPESSAIQDSLLENGFIFSGVIPGISSAKYAGNGGQEREYVRSPVNVYALLRPDVRAKLRPPVRLRLDNPIYDFCLKEIAESWFK